jgi:putative ABC transport system permease protein
MQTLGYTRAQIAGLVVCEGAALSLTGGVIGILIGALFTSRSGLSLSVEGLSVHISAGFGTIALGLAISLLIGVVAGFIPALQAFRRDIAGCFRAN